MSYFSAEILKEVCGCSQQTSALYVHPKKTLSSQASNLDACIYIIFLNSFFWHLTVQNMSFPRFHLLDSGEMFPLYSFIPVTVYTGKQRLVPAVGTKIILSFQTESQIYFESAAIIRKLVLLCVILIYVWIWLLKIAVATLGSIMFVWPFTSVSNMDKDKGVTS